MYLMNGWNECYEASVVPQVTIKKNIFVYIRKSTFTIKRTFGQNQKLDHEVDSAVLSQAQSNLDVRGPDLTHKSASHTSILCAASLFPVPYSKAPNTNC